MTTMKERQVREDPEKIAIRYNHVRQNPYIINRSQFGIGFEWFFWLQVVILGHAIKE